MPAIIPAYCKDCGAMFASRAFSISNSTNVRLEGNTETCISCGGRASIVDGVFDATDGLIRLVSGPQFTKDILAAFAVLIEQAKSGAITEDEFEKKAEALSPELGTAVRKLKGLKKWPVLLLALVALQQCRMEVKVDVKLDANDLFRQTIELVDRLRAESDSEGTEKQNQGGNSDPFARGAKGERPDVGHGWKTSVHPKRNN